MNITPFFVRTKRGYKFKPKEILGINGNIVSVKLTENQDIIIITEE